MSKKTEHCKMRKIFNKNNATNANLLSSEDWLDIIFKERNHEYGAYVMRSRYARRLSFSLAVVFVTVLLVLAVVFGVKGIVGLVVHHKMSEIEEAIKLNPINLEEEKKKKVVEEGRRETAETRPDAPPEQGPNLKIISKEEFVANQVEEVVKEGPKQVKVGETTLVAITQDSLMQQDEAAPITKNDTLTPTVVIASPLPPGGWQALLKWIGENLGYPIECIRDNIGGEVKVKFYVDTDGTIKNATIVKSLNPQLDNEALRIVKKMPKWRPRMVNGTPSRCDVILPIEFDPSGKEPIVVENDGTEAPPVTGEEINKALEKATGTPLPAEEQGTGAKTTENAEQKSK